MRRHPLDAFALVCGLLGLACAGAWLAWDQDLVTFGELALAAPITLIAVGVIGVAASLHRSTPRRPADVDHDHRHHNDTDLDKETP